MVHKTPALFTAFIDLCHEDNVETAITLYSMVRAPFLLKEVPAHPTHIALERLNQDPYPWLKDTLTFFLQSLGKRLHWNYYLHITQAQVIYPSDRSIPYVIEDHETVDRAVSIEDVVTILCDRPDDNPDICKCYGFTSNPITDGVKYWHGSDVKFALNSGMQWNFEEDLPDNIPIWVLAEEDTCDPTKPPSIFRIIHEPKGQGPYQNRLLDFDPEHEEEYLSGNNWEIVAWRLMTQHNGTYDKLYAKDNITELSNWKMDLKSDEPSNEEVITSLTDIIERESRIVDPVEPDKSRWRARHIAIAIAKEWNFSE